MFTVSFKKNDKTNTLNDGTAFTKRGDIPLLATACDIFIHGILCA